LLESGLPGPFLGIKSVRHRLPLHVGLFPAFGGNCIPERFIPAVPRSSSDGGDDDFISAHGNLDLIAQSRPRDHRLWKSNGERISNSDQFHLHEHTLTRIFTTGDTESTEKVLEATAEDERLGLNILE
jgi:hypothetical protein